MMAKLNPNFQQIADQMLLNMRPPMPGMVPEIPFLINPGMAIPAPPSIANVIRHGDDFSHSNDDDYK